MILIVAGERRRKFCIRKLFQVRNEIQKKRREKRKVEKTFVGDKKSEEMKNSS